MKSGFPSIFPIKLLKVRRFLSPLHDRLFFLDFRVIFPIITLISVIQLDWNLSNRVDHFLSILQIKSGHAFCFSPANYWIWLSNWGKSRLFHCSFPIKKLQNFIFALFHLWNHTFLDNIVLFVVVILEFWQCSLLEIYK